MIRLQKCERLLHAMSVGKPGSSCRFHLNRLKEAAHHSPHTGTMLKLSTVEHASSSSSGGSGGAKKKVNLPLEELLQGSSTQLGS